MPDLIDRACSAIWGAEYDEGGAETRKGFREQIEPRMDALRAVFAPRLTWLDNVLTAGPMPLGFVAQNQNGWRYYLSGPEPSRFCGTEAEARAALEAAAVKALFGEMK